MTLPETMTAVLLTGHGGPEKLALRNDVAVPTPRRGEVVIRVHAAGVNNTDLNTRVGWYAKTEGDTDNAAWAGTPFQFPRIQGADACGTIAAVGEGVDPSRLGQRVLVEPSLQEMAGEALPSPWYFGSECDGAFAQYTRVAARHAFAVDSPLSDVDLASFPCSYSTAMNMILRGQVGAGDQVLVTGASGGVGSAAVQIARARGAEVIAQASATKHDQLRALGAARCLDRGVDPLTDLGTNAVDAVIDLVAGPGWPSLLEVLRPFGRYMVSGAIAGPHVALDVRTLYLKDLTLRGCTILDPETFPTLVAAIEAGTIQPLVAATFPLAEITAAQAAFAQKAHTGKIVLTIP